MRLGAVGRKRGATKNDIFEIGSAVSSHKAEMRFRDFNVKPPLQKQSGFTRGAQGVDEELHIDDLINEISSKVKALDKAKRRVEPGTGGWPQRRGATKSMVTSPRRRNDVGEYIS